MGVPVIAATAQATVADPNTASVPEPGTTTSGDLLLIMSSVDNSGASQQFDDSSNKPSGFTLINHAGGGSGDCHTAAWWKAYAGDESWPISVPYAASGEDQVAFSARITGANLTSPIHKVGSDYDASGSSHALSGVTTTVDNCLIIYVLGFDGGDGASFSVSGTGYTEAAEAAVSGAGNTSSGCWGSRNLASYGASGTATVASSASDGATGFTFAILPAAVQNGTMLWRPTLLRGKI